jgi:tRNA1(Val) A37 N6-methylase TrmN6
VSRAELERCFGRLTEEDAAPGLRIFQPARGHRYGGEVYALAAFALGIGAPAPVPRALSAVELGSGSGVVSLLLARQGLQVRAWDRDPAWVELARASLARSPGARGGVKFSVRDIQALGRPGPADVVVTNPPWFDPAEGPVPADPRRATARAMLHGTVQDFVDVGLRLAPRVCVVTRAERLAELRLPGAHVARRAWLPGGKVGLVELRRGEGATVEEPLDVEAITAALRLPWRAVRPA